MTLGDSLRNTHATVHNTNQQITHGFDDAVNGAAGEPAGSQGRPFREREGYTADGVNNNGITGGKLEKNAAGEHVGSTATRENPHTTGTLGGTHVPGTHAGVGQTGVPDATNTSTGTAAGERSWDNVRSTDFSADARSLGRGLGQLKDKLLGSNNNSPATTSTTANTGVAGTGHAAPTGEEKIQYR